MSPRSDRIVPAILVALLAGIGWSGTAERPVPDFSHVFVIVAENKEFEEVIGNDKMPNFNRWADQYALLTRYFAVTHPSLPNYLAMISGDFFGIQSNCDETPYSHYSLLKTIAAAWGLKELGHAADPAVNLISLPFQAAESSLRVK